MRSKRPGDIEISAWPNGALPPAGDGEYGECWITRVDDPVNGTQFRIERADPVIRISPELLASIPKPSAGWLASFDGKTLRIQGVNQTVVYRIRDILEPVPGVPGMWDYIGEWPD